MEVNFRVWSSHLFHFGLLELLQSEFDFVCFDLRLDFLLNETNNMLMRQMSYSEEQIVYNHFFCLLTPLHLSHRRISPLLYLSVV